MLVEVQVIINGSRAAIWDAITNIGNAAHILSGVDKIEVPERPAQGLIGLKWRETRMLFGKPASADKWITDAADNEFYKTRAESDGFVFLSTLSMSGSEGGVTLTSVHDSLPQTIGTRIMSIPMSLFFKGVAKKALLQDLNDIKSAVEQQRSHAQSADPIVESRIFCCHRSQPIWGQVRRTRPRVSHAPRPARTAEAAALNFSDV